MFDCLPDAVYRLTQVVQEVESLGQQVMLLRVVLNGPVANTLRIDPWPPRLCLINMSYLFSFYQVILAPQNDAKTYFQKY